MIGAMEREERDSRGVFPAVFSHLAVLGSLSEAAADPDELRARRRLRRRALFRQLHVDRLLPLLLERLLSAGALYPHCDTLQKVAEFVHAHRCALLREPDEDPRRVLSLCVASEPLR